MTSDVMDDERPGLIARVRNILFRPQSEWRRVAGEEPGPLIGPYVAPLAIVGAAAHLGSSVLYRGFELDAGLAWRGVSALLYIVFAVLGVVVSAMLINFLAKRFGAEGDAGRAKQLAAYAATPILVAALGAFAPPVSGGIAGVGVIYAFVLMGIGVGQLLPMPDAENNAPRFTISFAAAFAALAALSAAFVGPLLTSGREALTGAVEAVAPAPSAPPIAQRSAVELAMARLAQNYGAEVLSDPARLEEQLPDSLPGGFTRQSLAKAQGGGVSRADAAYAQGAATLNISVIQFSRDIDPAAGAALFNIKPDGAGANRYARTQTIDGRFYAEEVDGDSTRYIVIGRGVAMIAEGRTTSDQARAAIETIDLQRLEAAFGG
jgi:hypothetical protein